MVALPLARRRGAVLLALASAALASCGGGGGGGGAPAVMAVAKTQAFFVARPGADPASPTQTIPVARSGGGALAKPSPAVTHGTGAGGWLAAEVTGAAPPYALALTVASAALAPGRYGATVTLGAPGASDAHVEVTLAVEDPPGARTVTGRVTYDAVPSTFDVATGTGGLDFAHAEARPVRDAVVRATFDGAPIDGASTTTDGDGDYALTFTPPATVGLAIEVAARTLAPAITVRDNTDGGAVWGMFADLAPGDGAKDLRATHGWLGAAYDPLHRVAAPFAILDATYGAAAAFRAERTVAFEPLTVYWSPDNQPSSTWNPAAGLVVTTQYLPAHQAIYVLGKDGVDTDEFDGHVVVHEWGHFLEDTLSRSDTIGGPHGPGDVLDPRVAWSEGSSNALAAILLGRPVYADTFWQGDAPAAFGFDAETEPPPPPGGAHPADDPSPGAFSEITIFRLVYDLYDPDSAPESFDGVRLGIGELHDVLAGHQKATPALTTVASFVTGVKGLGAGTASAAAVDALLAHHGIGPITGDLGEGDDGLAAMFEALSTPPSATAVAHALTLEGGHPYNSRAQNRYVTFTGTGRPVTVTSSSAHDVDLHAYRAGVVLDRAARAGSGDETLTFDTAQDQLHVVSVVGHATAAGEYGVTLSFRSP